MNVKFKNKDNKISRYTIDSLGAEKCLIREIGSKRIMTLTPKYLDMVHDDQELVDFYGSKKTKKEFLSDRGGVLYPSKNGGATIFGIEISEG